MKKEDLLSQSPWCCGTLQTGAIAVGFTNLVSGVLLFIWYIQFVLDLQHAFIGVIVSTLCSFVILLVNGCLIYGAYKVRICDPVPFSVLTILVSFLLA